MNIFINKRGRLFCVSYSWFWVVFGRWHVVYFGFNSFHRIKLQQELHHDTIARPFKLSGDHANTLWKRTQLINSSGYLVFLAWMSTGISVSLQHYKVTLKGLFVLFWFFFFNSWKQYAKLFVKGHYYKNNFILYCTPVFRSFPL